MPSTSHQDSVARAQHARKSLRFKVLAVFGIVGFASFGALSLGAHTLVTARFLELENGRSTTNLERLEEVLADQMSIPATKIPDWANWDDTFDFAKNRTPKYVETNLIPGTLDNVGLSSLRIYDLGGTKIAAIDGAAPEGASNGSGSGNASESGNNFPALFDRVVTEHPNILANPSATEAQKGWIFVDGQMFSYASLPIRPGSGEGDAAGVMLFLKLADQKFLERVSELTKFKVSFAPRTGDLSAGNSEASPYGKVVSRPSELPGLAESWFAPVSEDTLLIGSRAKDIDGRVFGQFSAELPRDIRAEGERTLKSLLMGSAVMLAVMFVALLVAIDRFVIGRILGLNSSIENIRSRKRGVDEPEFDHGTSPALRRKAFSNPGLSANARVPDLGPDEIGGLSKAINAMLDNIDEANRSIREIVSNVQSGFLMVDAEGRILPGHTDHCRELFGSDVLVGHSLTGFLFGSEPKRRDRQTYDFLFSQIFDDILPEETATGQLPRAIKNGDRWFSLDARVIRNERGVVKSVLFTIADVTALKATERKVEEVQALLQILQAKEVFTAFVSDLPETLDKLRLYVGIGGAPAPVSSSSSAEGSRPLDARKLLHTLKGNFAMFGLGEIARTIHHIEDSPTLSLEQIDSIEEAFKSYLSEYQDLLGIRYGEATESQYTISAAALEKLARVASHSASSSADLRNTITQFVNSAKLTRIDKALEPIGRAGEILAQRLGKDVAIKIEPSPLLVDYASCHGIFEALINSIRNAIDHGIEAPEARIGKPSQGTISLRAKRTADDLVIEVADDGRGVDFERLGQVLENRGICSLERYKTLSDSERIEFLFQGSISTAESVSEISGRGLGLAGLRNEARNLGGDVTVSTVRGQGTTISVSLPLRRREARLVA